MGSSPSFGTQGCRALFEIIEACLSWRASVFGDIPSDKSPSASLLKSATQDDVNQVHGGRGQSRLEFLRVQAL